MKYLSSMLGVTVRTKKWEKEKCLPYYITDRYRIEKVWIDQVCAFFLYPKTELDLISAIKKYIQKIQEIESLPVVLVLKTISRKRCQYFLDSRIPFIVENKQIYLPFMGIALQEKFDSEHPSFEKLQPSAQMLLFYYMYQNKEKLYTSSAVEDLAVSAMTISRAVKQLEKTGLFYTEKDGVLKILIAKQAREELFHRITPWLINPVRKSVYISINDIDQQMMQAGYSALSKKTMLSPSSIRSYAIDSVKANVKECTAQLFDAERQVQLQLWKYDPGRLSKECEVDDLSLALSLSDDIDERVEDAVEELLNKLWRRLDDNRI